MQQKAPFVAVLSGGYSAEAGISRQSAEVVLAALREYGMRCIEVAVERRGWFAGADRTPVDLNEGSFLHEGRPQRPDIAFIAIHGTPGEDGRLQGMLDILGIPYTGCDHIAAALTFDKELCKRAVAGTGVRLAPSVLLRREDDRAASIRKVLETLEFPVFIKPNRNGSSFGVSKVSKSDAIEDALDTGFGYDERLLVESAVSGVEVTCGVFTRKGVPEALPLCEIIPQHEFFDFHSKYSAGGAQEIVPATISQQESARCVELSLALYRKLDCRGLVRFDYLLDEGDFWFLEVNTVPGLSRASIVPKMLHAAGWELGAFFAHLIEEALSKTPAIVDSTAPE